MPQSAIRRKSRNNFNAKLFPQMDEQAFFPVRTGRTVALWALEWRFQFLKIQIFKSICSNVFLPCEAGYFLGTSIICRVRPSARGS
ncbi:MAG: hypothetical protein DESF_00864 [Desulfovibrio sp.]